MTPEQLMEIPGIGEKMIDKIYQAVNRFYESGEAAAAAPAEGAVETTDEIVEEGATEAPVEETSGEEASAEAVEATETAEPAAHEPAEHETAEHETAAEHAARETVSKEAPAETPSAAVESPEGSKPAEQQEEKNS
jgi:hypothetical protein